jgi:hypothetical protein
MIGPSLSSRIEKPYHFSSHRIKTSQIWTFVAVAMQAGECQIV